MRKRHGFILMDAVLGLGVITLLILILALALGQQQRTLRDMSKQRVAVALAEQVLVTLQTSGRVPPVTPAQTIRIERLKGVNNVPERVWVTVHAEHEDRSTTLTGLVGQDAIMANEGTSP